MFSWDNKAPPSNLTIRALWYFLYFLQMIIALLSSMAVKSRYCQDELALSYVSNKPIFPVAIQTPSELFPLMDTGMWVHGDVIKWKHFPRYWPFVRGIHRSPVNSPHRGQWRGTLMFSLIRTWINVWVNNREAGDLKRHRAHYDVIVKHKNQQKI